MKSICIKTNNSNLLDYLLNEFRLLEMDQIYFSTNEFKFFKNVIIHYRGNDDDAFVEQISHILSYLVLDELEEGLLKKIIIRNYFYFDALERKKILDFCFDICSEDFTNYFDHKFTCLSNSFSDFLNSNDGSSSHKSIVLSGFTNFRLPDYLKILEEVVDEAVNTFLIEKEYMEFISLLKLYISSQKPQTDVVHLVYLKENPILLDNNRNIIPINKNSLDAKYLSDISFSSNDYLLNTLLNLLPNKFYIHLDENFMDEFISTLILIFDGKVELCNDCNLCAFYKKHNINSVSGDFSVSSKNKNKIL